jgi:hypothetical protein
MVASIFYTQWRLNTPIKTKYILWSILGFGVAYVLWVLDLKHIVCEPHSLWQLHSVWHLLSAASALFIFMYYLSEEEKQSKETASTT